MKKEPFNPSEADLCQFPGVWPLGSREDEWIVKWRTEQVSNDYLLDSSKHAEAGLVDPEIDAAWNRVIPIESFSNDMLGNHYNYETLAVIDYRLRWCRCFLNAHDYPWDREPIVVIYDDDGAHAWQYESEAPDEFRKHTRHDPLHHVLADLEQVRSLPWYAAKVLAHNRRAEILMDTEQTKTNNRHDRDLYQFGIAREWMLFGETFSELRFLAKHSGAVLARWAQIDPFARNNEGRRLKNAERAREAAEWQDAARALARETNLTGNRRARWISTVLKSRYGIARNPKTITNFFLKEEKASRARSS